MFHFNQVKELILPRRGNNYRARVLHPSFLAFFVFLFLANQLLINFTALIKPGVLGYSSEITPERIVELTNQQRVGLGQSELTINSVLSEAARRKAGDMFAFDYWAHTSPSGRDPWTFFKEAGYDYRLAGENLARDFSDPDSVVRAWMKSPSHRENIVNGKFQEIGVAVVDGTLGGIQTTLVVQFFATPSGAIATSTQPVVAPKVELASEIQTGVSLGTSSKPLLSPLGLTRVVSAFLFGLIAGALLIDAYLVLRKKIYRSVGRTTAHAGFLAIMFLLILLSQQGIVG
ncbi:MAG: CAP domain-containing protein [Patescibacteria group bacterium]